MPVAQRFDGGLVKPCPHRPSAFLLRVQINAQTSCRHGLRQLDVFGWCGSPNRGRFRVVKSEPQDIVSPKAGVLTLSLHG